MVNKERMLQWIEALESGKYQQTTGRLKDATGYCCLGVLCDISGLGEWDDSGLFSMDESLDGAIEPPPVDAWLGVPQAYILPSGRALTTLNDNGTSFAEITQILRLEYDL